MFLLQSALIKTCFADESSSQLRTEPADEELAKTFRVRNRLPRRVLGAGRSRSAGLTRGSEVSTIARNFAEL